MRLRAVLIPLIGLGLLAVAFLRLRPEPPSPAPPVPTGPPELRPAEAGRIAANAPPPPPESGAPASTAVSKGRTVDLGAAVARFAARVETRTSLLRGLLAKRRPEESLALLTGILDRQVPFTDGAVPEERVDRVLAAGFLCWVAAKDPALKGPIVLLIGGRLKVEPDPLVRDQFLGDVGGFLLKPDAVVLRSSGGDARAVELFVPGSADAAESWIGSLRADLSSDPAVLEAVRGIAADRTNRSRGAAVQTLLSGPSESGGAIVAALFAADPTIRVLALQPMLSRPRPEFLGAFAAALRNEPDPLLIGPMARALETATQRPEGAGAALRSCYETMPEGQDASKFPLVNAAGAVFRSAHDADSLRCMTLALESPQAKLRAEAARVAARYPDPQLAPLLQTRLSGARDGYEQELLSYALGKCDSGFQGPSLLRDIDQLQSRLQQGDSLPEAERRRIREQIDSKEQVLEDLRTRR